MGISAVEIKEAADFIQSRINRAPAVAMILGSGLGDLAEEIEESVHIPYNEIPHFPVSTVEGHAGRLVIGKFQGKEVIAMQGRFHYYEGYSMQEVTFPVRVMKSLGAENLIVTNACGGMNKSYQPGDLMVIEDHLNMTNDNPLIGENLEAFGPRFPDMSTAYNKEFQELAHRCAEKDGLTLQQGVYAGITGPYFMSAAELIMLRRLGGDVVGMSTVPEVIVAQHSGMNVLGISCVTDMAVGEDLQGVTHQEVMETAARTKPKFISLVKKIIKDMPA